MCKDKFEECLEPIKEILKSEEEINDIDEIILVGGSIRIPKIQEELKKFFNKNINIKLNPDEAVAYEATIEAAMEMGKFSEDITLLDVIPFSIGIAAGKSMFKYFEKGAKIPCNHTQVFETRNGGGTGIEIYEGENELVKYNYPIGNFVFKMDYIDLRSLSDEKKKEDKYKNSFNYDRPLIDITFELNSDSILTVTAVETSKDGNSQQIKIDKLQDRLSEEEINKLIEDAKRYEEFDNKRKEAINAKSKLLEYIIELENKYPNNSKLINKCKEIRTWVTKNKEMEKEDYDSKFKELQKLV